MERERETLFITDATRYLEKYYFEYHVHIPALDVSPAVAGIEISAGY